MNTTAPIVLSLLAMYAALTGCASSNAVAVRPLAVPPDADGAVDALVDSPRHGEWVDVPAPADDDADAIRTWVVFPERPDPAPVVIVIHEIFGLTDWVRGVADQLAAEGYLAVAPDLLSGKGPDGGGSSSFSGDTVRAAIRGLERNEVNARLDAVRNWAIARPAAANAVGCTGFCWGGSTTFAYATHQPDLAAAIVWYGTAPDDAALLARINTPVLGLYGGDDARVTSTVVDTARRMREAGRAYTPVIYEGAGHGFLRQQDGRDSANRAAAEAGWRAMLETLRREFAAHASADRRPADPTPASCPVIDSRGWAAMIDRMPNPNGPRLVVTGRIELPTPGYTVTWREGPADRMAPPAQVLELVLTPPDGVVAQVVTTLDVRYDGPARFRTYRAIRVRCGDASLAEITTVKTVH